MPARWLVRQPGETRMATTSTRLDRLSQELGRRNIEHAVLTSIASLRYFAGFTTPIEWGPSPFSPLLGALVWVRGEQPGVLLADGESAPADGAGLAWKPFASYTVAQPLHALQDLNAKLTESFQGLPKSRVGIEHAEIPAAILEPLRAACPQLEFVDVSSLLQEIRVIKDREEIQLLREAIALCDLGQELAKKLARPGMSEIELFAEIRRGMEMKEGGRLPMLVDVVSGARTAQMGGPPSARTMQEGDLLLCDLVPRHNGYWGDSCNTLALGEPAAEFKTLFQGLAEVLAQGTALVRPGLAACELDHWFREHVRKLHGGYPHHTGHGLGVTWHEEPRIVPYNTTPLRAGMVIALEPGAYFDRRWGMRLEHVALVTDTGVEVLTRFKHTL